MKTRLTWLIVAVLLLTLIVPMSQAQVSGPGGLSGGSAQGTAEPVDTDGDGIPDDSDLCPREAGPIDNRGCPMLVPTNPPVPVIPQPTELAIPESTEVVETTSEEVPPAATEIFVVAFPDGDTRCLAQPASPTNVNVRGLPSVDSPVVGLLAPAQVAEVINIYTTIQAEIWLQLAEPVGWVRADVVVLGGDCNLTPNTVVNPARLTANPTTPPEECPPTQRCVSSWLLEFAAAEPLDIELEHVCTEDGVCVGGLTTPLPEPLCSTLGLCCDPLRTCHHVLLWQAADPVPDPGIEVLSVLVALAPPEPEPQPDPVPFWLTTLSNPDDPNPQTREHILLARQVNVPFDDPTEPVPMLELLLAAEEPEPVALLLPAVQAAREAARRPVLLLTSLIEPDIELPDDLVLSAGTEPGSTDKKSCYTHDDTHICVWTKKGKIVAVCSHKEGTDVYTCSNG